MSKHKLNDVPQRLPDFRNLGVIARALIGVNLGVMFHLLLVASGWAAWREQMLSAAMWAEPALLLTLGVLAALQDVLKRMNYVHGLIATVMIAILAMHLLVWLWGDLLSNDARQIPWRFELVAGLVAAGLLFYYRLWMKALSPRVAEARLAALQARINPHFFFNSLNAVLSLIRTEPRRAERVLENLSDLFRVAMGKQEGLVSLSSEVRLASGYLEIEKVRLGERLSVEWFIDKMPARASIPPLILQPLVENAVYHGIEPSVMGGAIQVNVYRARDEVHIDIRNPLLPVSERRRKGNGIALENVRERLLLHFDAEASLTTQTGTDYYQVHIMLPYRELTDDEATTIIPR